MKLFPWSGFLYELRRALSSIPLLVVTALIILASFGILATIAASHPVPSTSPEESGIYYFAGGEYHFEFYTYTQSGAVISGALFELTMYPANTTPYSPTTPIGYGNGTTGSNGLVDIAVPLSGPNYSALMEWSVPSSPNTLQGPGTFEFVTRPPAGEIEPFTSAWTNTIQTIHHLLLSNALLIFYPGPNGTAPPDYQVYWAASPNETIPATSLPESAMHRLGTLTALGQVFSLTVPSYSGPIESPFGYYLQVELFTRGGQLVATDTNQSAFNFFPPASGAGASVAFGFSGTIMDFLVPLMAILAAYSVYGRDRLTGVLEGVLARPVSRLGLATSRYLAVIAALCLAVAVAMACLDGLIFWVYGGFLPVYAVVVLIAALLVEIGAFTGITFLLSYTLKSAAGLVGIGLGLFALFTLGWLIIPNVIGGFTGTIFTIGYDKTLIRLEFVNPVQFLDLTTDLYYSSVSLVSGLGVTTVPAAYGVTLASVVGTGLAWVIAPVALLLYLVRIRD